MMLFLRGLFDRLFSGDRGGGRRSVPVSSRSIASGWGGRPRSSPNRSGTLAENRDQFLSGRYRKVDSISPDSKDATFHLGRQRHPVSHRDRATTAKAAVDALHGNLFHQLGYLRCMPTPASCAATFTDWVPHLSRSPSKGCCSHCYLRSAVWVLFHAGVRLIGLGGRALLGTSPRAALWAAIRRPLLASDRCGDVCASWACDLRHCSILESRPRPDTTP